MIDTLDLSTMIVGIKKTGKSSTEGVLFEAWMARDLTLAIFDIQDDSVSLAARSPRCSRRSRSQRNKR